MYISFYQINANISKNFDKYWDSDIGKTKTHLPIKQALEFASTVNEIFDSAKIEMNMLGKYLEFIGNIILQNLKEIL